MMYSKIIIIVTVLFICIDGSGQEPGFFLDDWSPKTAELPESEYVNKTSDSATVDITIDVNQQIAKIPKYIYGNNAVTWDSGLPKNETAMTDLKNLNPHVLRWPGGNLSNNYFWNRSTSNPPTDIPDDTNPWYGQNTTWQLSVDQYYDMLVETNSTGIICVNYSYARYGTGPNPVATAAHMAAEWVRYDNGRSKYWEIGNENYGNWQAGYQIDVSKNQDGQPEYITGQLYGQHCKVFMDSMRAAAAEIGVDIKIGIVVYDAETSYDAISQDWNEGVMPEVGDLADFLAVHSYFTPYNENSTISTILNSHTVPEEIMNALETDMAEAEKPMIPVAMTEWNIFAVGSMQQVSYINGMLAALTLGEYVKNGYGAANRWDLVNGWSEGNDHGMFSSGGEPDVDPYNPRPVFFYMYYFQKYMGDNMVESTADGNSNVVVHASTFESGETGFVIINKSRNKEVANVEINNLEPGLRYYTHTLTGGTDNGDFSRKVFVNGFGTDEEGGGPDNYESIKANSSRTRDGIKVELPPLSVVYVMVDKEIPLSFDFAKIDTNANVISIELSENVLPFESAPGFEVIANSTTSLTITNVERDENEYIVNLFVEDTINNDDVITISYSGVNIVSADSVELTSFTNKSVENQLPGDPVTVEFFVKNSESDEFVENCEVIVNNDTLFTDENGKASIIIPEGEYNVFADKLHLDSIVNKITISSDTLITLHLDSTYYNVNFYLEDMNSGDKLSFVSIEFGSVKQTTNSAGEVSISVIAGTHLAVFEKTNYSYLQTVFDISSDTSITVGMFRSHADVKFKLLANEQPVNNALVMLGNDTLYTSSLGICTFKSIAITSNLDYQSSKEKYYPIAGNILVLSDTTIVLNLEKSVANVEFIVSSETGVLQNAKAIFNNDTVNLDTEGSAKFYNLDKNIIYEYVIAGDNISDYVDSVTLINDTTISIELIISSVESIYNQSEIVLYPNPANNILYIQSEYSIEYVEIINLHGKLIGRYDVEVFENKIDITKIRSGYYLIKIRCSRCNKEEVRPLIINK